MVEAMGKALDELMGKHRNVTDAEAKKRQMHFDDPEVCKHELAGLCPFTLFNNTKSDLGSCGFEIHQGHREFERIKKDYDALSEAEKDERGYERVLYDLLVHLVHRMDRTIAMNKKTVEKDNQPRPIKPVDQARLDALTQQEAECIENSEKLAMDGDADGSLAMNEAASKFREEHDKLRLELITPERTKSVCEVCGVFINSTDSEQRLQDHINGKQYVGWNKIRVKLKELEPKHKRGGRHDNDYARRPTSREREREPRGYDSRYGSEHDGHRGGESRSSRYGDRYAGDRYGSDRGADRYSGDRGGGDRYGGEHRGGYGRERGSDRYGERDRYAGRREDWDRRSGGSRGYDDRSYRRG